MTETLEDKKLIALYLAGNTEMLEALIGKYLKPIYSFVYKNVGNPADAEDITQEVFVRVWKNLRKFDQSKALKPWLFQIARNASIDFLRKKKTIPFSRFEDEKGHNVLSENIVAAPANLIEKLSDKKVILGAMQNLTGSEQKLINMRHKDGMSFKEIAEILNESINTVKSRYRRILANMKKNIRE